MRLVNYDLVAIFFILSSCSSSDKEQHQFEMQDGVMICGADKWRQFRDDLGVILPDEVTKNTIVSMDGELFFGSESRFHRYGNLGDCYDSQTADIADSAVLTERAADREYFRQVEFIFDGSGDLIIIYPKTRENK